MGCRRRRGSCVKAAVKPRFVVWGKLVIEAERLLHPRLVGLSAKTSTATQWMKANGRCKTPYLYSAMSLLGLVLQWNHRYSEHPVL